MKIDKKKIKKKIKQRSTISFLKIIITKKKFFKKYTSLRLIKKRESQKTEFQFNKIKTNKFE